MTTSKQSDSELVFAEPWEAQAFALAVQLSEQGHFTWNEWTTALADQIKASADRGEPDDDGTRYYQLWLATLEWLVTEKGLCDRAAMIARKEAWADAYRHTPHGKPVELDLAAQSMGNPEASARRASTPEEAQRHPDSASSP